MTKPVITDIYCRVAVNGPDTEELLDKQEQICRHYCQANGLPVGLVFRDAGSGMTYRDRPGLTNLRKRARTGQIGGICMTEISRWTRESAHMIILLEELLDHQVELHTAQKEAEDSTLLRLAWLVLPLMHEVQRQRALDSEQEDREL